MGKNFIVPNSFFPNAQTLWNKLLEDTTNSNVYVPSSYCIFQETIIK
jgi:hypothetical protein